MGTSPLADSTSQGSLSPQTSVRVGLVGRGIGQSRTPGMHMAEGAALGLAYTYDLIDPDTMAEAPSLETLIARAEAEGYAGLNITFPYKRDVIALLDALSPAAQRVGAVNTVVFEDGKRRGHNTDFWGFGESLRRGLPDASRKAVLLLGAGGAGGAVAHALRDTGTENLFIFDRDEGLANDLAAQVGAEVPTSLAEAADLADGIVNATPMGMAKLPGTAMDVALIQPRHWVADIVYFPRETELLRAARARGCQVLDGSGMAVFQAVRAFKLFSGLEPDPARMRATFEAFENQV
ncbi:shikimate dehydrogenase [Pseudooceanicola spongiae]|uniref:Shikimate dehydrogenase (NADP(+)) n=1 Tax=Pseudooceanicola spongiae TaxID=2613965 RepID=A0A7L9WJ79_9RHOB|nr:shikimate dehydrogenase [Pseudooceanicola spongiae]QOL80012.1 shikimate dehydrogenase [Pseudooceanicola spongiae]